ECEWARWRSAGRTSTGYAMPYTEAAGSSQQRPRFVSHVTAGGTTGARNGRPGAPHVNKASQGTPALRGDENARRVRRVTPDLADRTQFFLWIAARRDWHEIAFPNSSARGGSWQLGSGEARFLCAQRWR